MPQVERWDNLPKAVRQHLIERMHDRAIGVSGLNQLASGLRHSLRFRRVTGTRILALSSSAVADRLPRRSCSEAKLQKGEAL